MKKIKCFCYAVIPAVKCSVRLKLHPISFWLEPQRLTLLGVCDATCKPTDWLGREGYTLHSFPIPSPPQRT